MEQLGLAKKRQFGLFSEHMQEELMDQLSLMANEAETYAYGTKNCLFAGKPAGAQFST